MKIKSVLAAVAAAAVLTTGSAVAFADAADTTAADTTGAEDSTADTTGTDSTEDTNSDVTSTDDTNADTGVEGVAAVVGIIALAGAAVVVSRKRA